MYPHIKQRIEAVVSGSKNCVCAAFQVAVIRMRICVLIYVDLMETSYRFIVDVFLLDKQRERKTRGMG